nr:GATA transcription factor 19-like [Ipomoea batatas]
MQHRCSSSCGHGNMVGHCSCGGAASSAAAFSMFLSMPNSNHHSQCYKTCAIHSEDENNMYSFAASSVDCTLSLATPSTRRFNENEKRGMSNFCWDILQPSKQPPPSSVHKSAAAADTIVPRRCANCDTTSTPLWRNGPRGPKAQKMGYYSSAAYGFIDDDHHDSDAGAGAIPFLSWRLSNVADRSSLVHDFTR